MKKSFLISIVSIFIAVSSIAQIDNGTNYVSDSKNKNIATNSQCDQIFTKRGVIINALVKDTLANAVKYKTCKDYITNATVSGAIVTLPTYEIDKIVFSNQLTKYYNVKRPITRSRNEIFKGQNVNPDESLKRNFTFPFRNQKSLSAASLKKPTLKTNTELDKSKFIFISGGFGNQNEVPVFTEIGFLKQKSKKFGIGSSFSLVNKLSRYGDTYDLVGLSNGPYDQYGNYVGTAGYNWNGFYSGNGPYNSSGDYIGYSGGYENGWDIIRPSVNYYSLLVDFKFNFLTKKRIQPFIITSLGGTYRSVGFISRPNNYSNSLDFISRISTGLDFISKNNKWVFSSFISWTSLDYIDQIIAFRLSYGF